MLAAWLVMALGTAAPGEAEETKLRAQKDNQPKGKLGRRHRLQPLQIEGSELERGMDMLVAPLKQMVQPLMKRARHVLGRQCSCRVNSTRATRPTPARCALQVLSHPSPTR